MCAYVCVCVCALQNSSVTRMSDIIKSLLSLPFRRVVLVSKTEDEAHASLEILPLLVVSALSACTSSEITTLACLLTDWLACWLAGWAAVCLPRSLVPPSLAPSLLRSLPPSLPPSRSFCLCLCLSVCLTDCLSTCLSFSLALSVSVYLPPPPRAHLCCHTSVLCYPAQVRPGRLVPCDPRAGGQR